MTIQPLPQGAIRAIGSSQVLVDPVAVVKELLDNALDAGATSVSVEISSNTLDVIQVKDNGHGIAPSDRVVVAKRYCTSKISSEAELLRVGGSSLGFRGEALASAAALSGSLDITTRVAKESAATILRIDGQGEVVSSEKTSSPIGTTVRLTDFLKSLSVRQRVALNNTDACLKRIKLTLQRYAFAQPCVRLSSRVLRAKSEKANFTYAPKLGGDIRVAAMKIVGANCATQCVSSVVEHAGFQLHAFLPKPEASPSTVSSQGSFISIDARPMSSCRGIAKGITKAFKDKLKGLHTNLSEAKDPFLYLDIRCPASSYDVNIEPAKDDVLFEDTGIVMEAVSKLFSAMYPEGFSTGSVDQEISEDGVLSGALEVAHEGADLFHATDSSPEMDKEGNPASEPPLKHLEQASPVVYRCNMFGEDEDDVDMAPSTLSALAQASSIMGEQNVENDTLVNNPWTMAKMNAPTRPLFLDSSSKDQGPRSHQIDLRSSPFPCPTKEIQKNVLPTPRSSSPLAQGLPFDPSHFVPQIRLCRDGRVIEDPQYEAASGSVRLTQSALPANVKGDRTAPHEGGLSLADIPHVTHRPRQPKRSMQKPFVNNAFMPPTKAGSPREKVWFDHLENIDQQSSPPKRRRLHAPADYSGRFVQGELGHIADGPHPPFSPTRNRDIREFVRRDPTTTPPPSSTGVVDLATGAENESFRDVRVEAPEINHNKRKTLDESGFITASNLLIPGSRPHALPTYGPQRSKRQKTTERTALAELNSNIHNTHIAQTCPLSHTLPIARPTSSGQTRTKSTHLLLETTPLVHRTYNLIYTYNTITPTPSTPLTLTRRFHDATPPLTSFSSFADDTLDALARQLHALLLQRGTDVTAEHDNSENSVNLPRSPTIAIRTLRLQLRTALLDKHIVGSADTIP